MPMNLKYYKKLLVAQSALDTASQVDGDKLPQATENAIYVVFGAGTSAGSVVVESAHDPNYAGTWANVGTIAWAAANRAHLLAVTGVHRALRVRISVAIVGGTVDAYALGN